MSLDGGSIWEYFHDLSQYLHETTPVEEGVLDMNRYENL